LKTREQKPDRDREGNKKPRATGQREGGPKRWGQGAGQTEMEKEGTRERGGGWGKQGGKKHKNHSSVGKRGIQGRARMLKRGDRAPRARHSPQLSLLALPGDSAASDTSLSCSPPFLFCKLRSLGCPPPKRKRPCLAALTRQGSLDM